MKKTKTPQTMETTMERDHDFVSLAASPRREQMLIDMLEELEGLETDDAIDQVRAIQGELSSYGVRLG